nr:VOC family protein [Streptomonospora salina]
MDDYRRPTWPDPEQEKQARIEPSVDDVDAAQPGMSALGAAEPWFQPDPDRWRVLLDPAGRPFCITVLA